MTGFSREKHRKSSPFFQITKISDDIFKGRAVAWLSAAGGPPLMSRNLTGWG